MNASTRSVTTREASLKITVKKRVVYADGVPVLKIIGDRTFWRGKPQGGYGIAKIDGTIVVPSSTYAYFADAKRRAEELIRSGI